MIPLRLDPGVLLRPIDGQFVPLEFVPPETPLEDQPAAARSAQPELLEIRSMIGEAQARRKYARVVADYNIA